MTQLIEVDVAGEVIHIRPSDAESGTGEPLTRQGEPQVSQTGVPARFSDAYSKAKSTIFTIASDLSEDIRASPEQGRPDEVEVQFALGFSAEANAWFVGATTESVFTIKFTWHP